MTALLTLAEAANELRVSADSVRRLVATGKLPVVYPVARRPWPGLWIRRWISRLDPAREAGVGCLYLEVS